MLYNTGVDDSGSVKASGTQETHYSLVGGNAVVFKHPAWYGVSGAQWISGSGNGTSGNTSNVFTLTFSLAGYDFSTASISGQFGGDDAVSVSLNGGTAVVRNRPAYQNLGAFTFSDGFQSGMNTLAFTVNNSGGGATGLVVSDLTGAADLLPTTVSEPATLALMSFGLLGTLGVGLRRRKLAAR
jgi:hypothetical protein|tara:strand:- start:119485 stop:120036 length:552 start_codon:yes stop_codon:yes gene_type:complete